MGLLRAARFRLVSEHGGVREGRRLLGEARLFLASPGPACSLCDPLSRSAWAEHLGDNGQVTGRPPERAPSSWVPEPRLSIIIVPSAGNRCRAVNFR